MFKRMKSAWIYFVLSVMVLAAIVPALAGCSAEIQTTTKTSVTTTTPVTTTAPVTTTPPTTTVLPTTTMAPPKTSSTVVNSIKPSGAMVTLTGYITTEDDFASKLGADTSGMINMKMMAMSGLGITRQMADGSWEFYFFNGNISKGDSVNGKWAFSGTAAQLDAWNLVLAVATNNPKASVSVTVTGIVKGDTMTNPGMDADGLYFPVITVSSIG
jgi:hypothetical protein